MAVAGWLPSQSSNRSLIAFSTSRVASGETSRSLVWPWNCGWRRNSDSSRQAPPVASSAVTAAARLKPIRSAWVRRPLSSAVRRPASWVPPSGVGTVLQYQPV